MSFIQPNLTPDSKKCGTPQTGPLNWIEQTKMHLLKFTRQPPPKAPARPLTLREQRAKWDAKRNPPPFVGLVKTLASYPAWTWPYPGDPQTITLSQAKENLEFLRRVANARLMAFIPFAAEHCGASLVKPAGSEPFDEGLEQLYHFCFTHFPELGGNVSLLAWLRGEIDPSIQGFLNDIGLYLGEVLRERHPLYDWVIDVDPEMASHHRPVLINSPGELHPWTLKRDPMHEVFVLFQNVGSFSPARVSNAWLRSINQSIDRIK